MSRLDELAAAVGAAVGDAVAGAIARRIPVNVDLWDSATIGKYLKCSDRQARERYAPLPTFPRPIRLPVPGKGKGHPLWKASEVIAWAEKHQEHPPRAG